jgi:hypothetical protein
MSSQTREQVFNDRTLQQWHIRRSYYAEVPIGSLDEQSQLVEQVMQFAFDTLGVRHLDVRVFGVDQECCRAYEQSLADRHAHHS